MASTLRAFTVCPRFVVYRLVAALYRSVEIGTEATMTLHPVRRLF